MKKLIFVLIAALGLSCTSYAQMTEKELKKATKTAQKTVKEARDIMEREDVPNKMGAKRLIDQAIKDPLLKDWDQTWFEAAEIYRYFYYDEDIKFSRRERVDTAAMYNLLLDWYKFEIKADSIQQIPNEKGKTSDEVRRKHAQDIHRCLPALIQAGIFYFNNRSDYKMAYNVFDAYFTMADNPIIKSYVDADSIFQQRRAYYSYFPALAAFNMQDWEKTLKYATVAVNDEENGEIATEFICESYGNMGDTVKWLETLKEGLVKFPTANYYYNKLLTYYKDDMAELEVFVEEMTKIDPDKAYNYFVLGFIAQQSKDYEKAINYYKTALEKDPEMTEALNNIGLCYMNQATAYVDSKSNVNYRSAEYKKVLQEEKEYYKKAQPYVEKLRELDPAGIRTWGIPLYQIYFKLAMDKELNDLEKLLKANDMI